MSADEPKYEIFSSLFCLLLQAYLRRTPPTSIGWLSMNFPELTIALQANGFHKNMLNHLKNTWTIACIHSGAGATDKHHTITSLGMP